MVQRGSKHFFSPTAYRLDLYALTKMAIANCIQCESSNPVLRIRCRKHPIFAVDKYINAKQIHLKLPTS